MAMNEIEVLIEQEILNASGLIDIDRTDVDRLKVEADKLAAWQEEGEFSQVCELFENVLGKMEKENAGLTCLKCLVLIKVSEEEDLTLERMSIIRQMFGKVGDGVDCLWGVASDKGVRKGSVKIVVLCGLKRG